jgi:hypothetical protein
MGKLIKAISYTVLQHGVPKLTTQEKRCIILQAYIHKCLNYHLTKYGYPQCGNFSKANQLCFEKSLITEKTFERCKAINNIGNTKKHSEAVMKLEEEFVEQ